MFYLTYIYKELRRRALRTILTVLGLALGVGMVASITAVSNGLDGAQASVLNPLKGVGTDLIVTRPAGGSAARATPSAAATPDANGGGGLFGGGGFGGPGGFDRNADQRQLLTESISTITTDLSKLGKAGTHFVHDYFLPATQLTFPSSQAATIKALPGVAAVDQGLTLTGLHQEGTVPKIVASLQTGGQTVTVDQNLTPPTPAEQAAIQACLAKRNSGGSSPAPTPSPGFGGDGDGGRGRGFFFSCLPERLRRFRGQFQTPRRVIEQVINNPSTDIKSDNYSISGVDASPTGLGVITPSQVTTGKFLSSNDANEALLATGYAERKGLAVGATLDLNRTTFTVVGLVKPPLGGASSDVYVPLAKLQVLSDRKARASVLLVRASDASQVAAVQKSIETAFPGSQVTSSSDVAKNVSGSLIDAASLSKRFGFILALVVIIASFLIATLLTLSSVAKRVRELGTLKAIGWRTRLVVRQVVGESLVQGLLGGVVGIALGFGAAALINAFGPTLKATAASTSSNVLGLFGLSQSAASASEAIKLHASLNPTVLIVALSLAVVGGLIAGTAGALRAARLRPAVALREIG